MVTSPFSPSTPGKPRGEFRGSHDNVGFTVPDSGPLPTLPSPDPVLDSYRPSADVGPQDLSETCQAIAKVRSLIIHIEHEIRVAAGNASLAKMDYERAVRRALLTSTGKTVADRQAIAEILVEDKEASVRLAELTYEHLKRLSTALRADLSALESIAHNLRAQMKLV